MAKYKCKNFGSCGKADKAEELEFPAGADEKCPECGTTLTPVDGSGDADGSPTSKRGRAVLVGVVAVVVAGGLIAYFALFGRSGDRVVIRPEPATQAVKQVEPSSAPPSAAASPATVAPQPMPAPMLAQETAARKSCEDATRANQPNAQQLCQRAAAVTLMNSGVLAAINGRLDDAERDYLAARAKDPDFPELYFNLAVVKARQNRGAESVDNLLLAEAKGFKQFAAIKSEPALQKLKSDPALKEKIERLEAKAS